MGINQLCRSTNVFLNLRVAYLGRGGADGGGRSITSSIYEVKMTGQSPRVGASDSIGETGKQHPCKYAISYGKENKLERDVTDIPRIRRAPDET